MSNDERQTLEVPTKLPRLSVYIEPETKKSLEMLAKLERRSVSQMAVLLIEESIERAKESGRLKTGE